MKLKIVNKSKHQLPAYSTEYSAGMDLRANIDEPVEKQQTELFNIANGRGGSGNQFYMVKAFEKALSRMPSPTLEYSEFSTFTKSVSSMNNLVKIK